VAVLHQLMGSQSLILHIQISSCKIYTQINKYMYTVFPIFWNQTQYIFFKENLNIFKYTNCDNTRTSSDYVYFTTLSTVSLLLFYFEGKIFKPFHQIIPYWSLILIIFTTEHLLWIVCQSKNIIWTEWNILGATDQSINCHLAQNIINYSLYYTQPTKTTSTRTQLDSLYGHS
jgi:hypothetical protein